MWGLCLLVQLFRACKSLHLWDEQEYSSHIFFMPSAKLSKNFVKAESGGKEAKKKEYEKTIMFGTINNYICTN